MNGELNESRFMKFRLKLFLFGFVFQICSPFFTSSGAQANLLTIPLFDPRNAISIVLDLSEAEWAKIVQEEPVGGVCQFNVEPTTKRFMWRQKNATIHVNSNEETAKFYKDIGIKKKSFCGSFSKTKPSISINLAKFNRQNKPLAKKQLGTHHFSLGNSKQDNDLFRQCIGYRIFRVLGTPAPMCSFAALYRQSSTDKEPIFLGIYVLIERIKKDFFARRKAFENSDLVSLYEFEYPDDFVETTKPQLQVEWSKSNVKDFMHAAKTVSASNNSFESLAKAFSLPSMIRYWSTEIAIKHFDGFISNKNNVYVINNKFVEGNDGQNYSEFSFVPHGLDQILHDNRSPRIVLNNSLSQKGSVIGRTVFADNTLRYYLLIRLASTNAILQKDNLSQYVEELLLLSKRLWRGQDPLLNIAEVPSDRSALSQMHAKVSSAVQNAVFQLGIEFGSGVFAPRSGTRFSLEGSSGTNCIATTKVEISNEIRHQRCEKDSFQTWKFDPILRPMNEFGFDDPMKLYALKNEAQNLCMEVGKAFGPGTHTLVIAKCNYTDQNQQFFMLKRPDSSFELRAFAKNGCAHFSGTHRTVDGKFKVYVAPCDGSPKNAVYAN